LDIQSIINFFKILLDFLPWLLSLGGLHIYLYNKYPKYYFIIARLFSKWRDTNWKLSASFIVEKDKDFFLELESILRDIYGNAQKKFNLKNKKQYEFGVFNLTVLYDMDISQSEHVTVDFEFATINVTLNTAKQKLKELRILFNRIEREMNIIDKSYSLNIFFNSIKNPFYGLMIQRLGEEHVSYFQCEFPISILSRKELADADQKDYMLTVFKNQITINEKEYDILEEISIKCLILE
jgi:hypothetical protein